MNINNIVQAFTVSLLICILANAQAVNQQSLLEDPESLRQILANQPDYTAMQQVFFTEGLVGFSVKSKVAKMGNRRVEVTEDATFITEPGKPTVKVFPKRKEYAEILIQEKDDLTVSLEELASRSDVVFKSLGMEKPGQHSRIKIEVSYKAEKLKEIKFVFWAAPELKNLVIRSATFVGGQSKFLTRLEEISLSVNEELFRIPRVYKKVRLEKNTRIVVEHAGHTL